ncbi:hypothetical protein EV138_0096 [Kribbella voronezhensis]|uniref:Uncharacterized protein n=1 Tax=Kribbella voronezhensis TaxID=2512212 RepID=A0A4R7T4P2_9ACTN|nr:hypothetical protein EV138_0096 [Kribbella voronezhensis]
MEVCGRSRGVVVLQPARTVHSFLAQAEYLGEVTCGLGIALTATLVTLPVALGVCAGLFAVTAAVMRRAPVSADLG